MVEGSRDASELNINVNNNDSSNKEKPRLPTTPTPSEGAETSGSHPYSLPPPLKDGRKMSNASAALLQAFEGTPPAAAAAAEAEAEASSVQVSQQFLNRNLGSDVSSYLDHV